MFQVNLAVGETGTQRRQSIVRLFIADDNIPFRNRLVSICSTMDGNCVVGESGDVPGAIEGITRLMPDTIILDIHMPGGNGLEVLQAAKALSPAPVVVMLTVGPRSEYETTCYLMGADYFFEKSSDLRSMVKLIENLAKKSTT
jgi:DNA-binding NarL/FixJ family response regulator